MNVVFIIIYFLQIWTIDLINTSTEGDVFLEIFDYLKKVIIFYEIIVNELTYKKIFIILVCIIFIDTLLIILTLLIKRINLTIFFILINYINIILLYYFIGPIVNIFLISTLCEKGSHIYLGSTCYTSPHLIYLIFSIIILLLSITITFIYSFYCN